MEKCLLLELGLVDYPRAWELQKALAQKVKEGQIPQVLLLLEHPPVYTIGRRGLRSHVLLGDEELQHLGIQVHWVDRGGEVTYHGPGQLVGYPILDLRTWGGPRQYVHALEEVLIGALRRWGLSAHRLPGMVGVWVRGAKIGAIGVRISGGVTTHGFALNVDCDLTYFNFIIPCGITHGSITSIQELQGQVPDMEEARAAVAESFARTFGFALSSAALQELGVGVGL